MSLGDGSFILPCLAATFNLKLKPFRLVIYACFLYIESKTSTLVSSRLQDQKPHHCLTSCEVDAPGERLNFCSYHTVPGRRAWQTSSLAQWGVSLPASTAKENRSSSSKLAPGCKMHHFRQIIPIKRAVVKGPFLQRCEKCEYTFN